MRRFFSHLIWTGDHKKPKGQDIDAATSRTLMDIWTALTGEQEGVDLVALRFSVENLDCDIALRLCNDKKKHVLRLLDSFLYWLKSTQDEILADIERVEFLKETQAWNENFAGRVQDLKKGAEERIKELAEEVTSEVQKAVIVVTCLEEQEEAIRRIKRIQNSLQSHKDSIEELSQIEERIGAQLRTAERDIDHFRSLINEAMLDTAVWMLDARIVHALEEVSDYWQNSESWIMDLDVAPMLEEFVASSTQDNEFMSYPHKAWVHGWLEALELAMKDIPQRLILSDGKLKEHERIDRAKSLLGDRFFWPHEWLERWHEISWDIPICPDVDTFFKEHPEVTSDECHLTLLSNVPTKELSKHFGVDFVLSDWEWNSEEEMTMASEQRWVMFYLSTYWDIRDIARLTTNVRESPWKKPNFSDATQWINMFEKRSYLHGPLYLRRDRALITHENWIVAKRNLSTELIQRHRIHRFSKVLIVFDDFPQWE